MSIFSAWFAGGDNAKMLKAAEPLLLAVNDFEPKIKALSDEALAGKTPGFKARLADGETLDDLLPEAYAVVREAASRTLNQRHFDVQIIGGIILHRGGIAEMRTGEGKTLTATLPLYLNALEGKGCHLVTVNDYLARRDADWMGQVYNKLGLSVGVINHDTSYLYNPIADERDAERDAAGSYKIFQEFLKPCSRAEAYAADITYGTNSEFGFDYLRDNMAYTPERVVGRRGPNGPIHHFAIVDEVDSILIDEARTPLIISAPVADSESLYGQFAKIAGQLEEEKDYIVDHKLKAASLTGEGITKAEKLLGVENLYTDQGIKAVHHLETAVRAKALYKKDKDYVIKDGEVVIVDEFTGRLQPGRRWSEGLHQAIEAKEGVKVQQESRTYATITYQNYFRLYGKLSGMTGTAQTSAEEFRKVYGLETVVVPTNRVAARLDLADLVFQTEAGKFRAVAKKIRELNKIGQPVLVGTASIEKNELLAAHLRQEGIPHQVLNAKNHEAEGAIIAAAGAPGSVVIATNLAGRGVDIKLGGPAGDATEAEKVKASGGLFVLGTERHEARRIDNQLRGRSGRQGDPGATQFFVSLEDQLLRVFASDNVKNLMGKLGLPEDEAISNRMVTRAIESAQEKIEGLNFDMRKHLLEYDDVMNHQRRTIYDKRNRLLFGGPETAEEFLLELAATADLTTDNGQSVEDLLAEKTAQLGRENVLLEIRRIAITVIDMLWVEHLEAMEYLRGSVRLRAYGQRDPLVEYKREGLQMFRDLELALGVEIVKTLSALNIKNDSTPNINFSMPESGKVGLPAEALAKVGRNDLCPCGSGKKYKKCHGA